MADSEKEFKIKITSAADTAGLDKTTKGIEQLRDATGKFTKTEEENKGASDKLDTSWQGLTEKTKKFIKSLGDAKEGGEKFNLSHRETIMLVNKLAPGVEGLGHIIADLKNPYIALALTIGLAVGKMVEFTKRMQELREAPTPDWDVQAEQLHTLSAAYDEADVAIAAYLRQLEAIRNHTEGPQDIADKRIAELKKEQAAQEQLLTAQKNLQMEAIEAEEKAGIITHDQAIQQKLQADQAYAKARIELEKQVRQAEIQMRQAELSSATYREHVQRGELGGAERSEADTKHAADRNKDKIDRDKKDLETALAFRKTNQDALNEVQNELTQYQGADRGNPVAMYFLSQAKKTMPVLEDQQAANEGIIARLRGNIGAGEARQPGLQDAANQAHEKLEALKESLKAVTTEIARLTAQIPVMQGDAGRANATAGAVAGADSAGRAIKFVESLSPQQLDAAGAGAEAMQNGQKVDAATKGIINSLSSLLGTNHSNLKDVLNIIKQGHQGQEGLKSEIAALQRAVQELAHRPPGLSGMHQ